MGRGEEGAGSAVDAHQRDTQSPPSETADMTCDLPADPRSTTSISSANSEPERGVKRGIHSWAREWQAAGAAAAEAYYMAIWPPPPFLFTFSSIYHIIMYFKCFNENRFRSTLHEFNINKSN